MKTDCFAHPGVSHFELSEDVLGHVVLSHGVHHEVLVTGRAFSRPVLMALLLQVQAERNICSMSIRTVGL